MELLSTLRQLHRDGTRRRASRRLTVIAMVALAFSLMRAGAQETKEYQVKGVLIFHLTQFVEWPSSAFETTNSPFVIGIVGTDPFDKALDEIVSGEKVSNRTIVIKRYDKIESAKKCHLLFINLNERELRRSMAQIKDQPILTVADEGNFIQSGGMIYLFKNTDKKVRVRINLTVVKSSGLTVSSKLLRVAEIVKSEEN